MKHLPSPESEEPLKGSEEESENPGLQVRSVEKVKERRNPMHFHQHQVQVDSEDLILNKA